MISDTQRLEPQALDAPRELGPPVANRRSLHRERDALIHPAIIAGAEAQAVPPNAGTAALAIAAPTRATRREVLA